MKSSVLSRFLVVAALATGVVAGPKTTTTATKVGFQEYGTCENPATNLFGPSNQGDYVCCGSKFGPKDKSYSAACISSSCVRNFNSKNLNCHNYGSPQNPIGGNPSANGGSALCPYKASDKAICDVTKFEEQNKVNCRDPNNKGAKVHCLGYVKCGTSGVEVPKKGHSNGKPKDPKLSAACASTKYPAGTMCFYNGYSENFKVCGADGEDDLSEVKRSKKDKASQRKKARSAKKAENSAKKRSKEAKFSERRRKAKASGKFIKTKKNSKKNSNKKNRKVQKAAKVKDRTPVANKRKPEDAAADFVPGQCVEGHICGEIRGDPHITTFGQGKFDCQGQGHFVAVKTVPSASVNKGFQIQTRHSSGSDEFKGDGTQITVLKAFVIDNGYADIPLVQGMATESNGECSIDYYFIKNAAGTTPVTTPANWADYDVTVIDYKRVGTGSKATDYLYFPATGLMFTVSVKGAGGTFGCRMNSKICLPPDFTTANKIVGMLGTPYGENFVNSVGAAVADPEGDSLAEYNYCVNNWCTKEADTIFTYFDGTKYADYDDCAAPFNDDFDVLMADAPDECKFTCKAAVANLEVGDDIDRIAAEDDCHVECVAQADLTQTEVDPATGIAPGIADGVKAAIGDMADAARLVNVEKLCPDPEKIGDAEELLKPKKLKSKKNKARSNKTARTVTTKRKTKAGKKKEPRSKEAAAKDFVPGECVSRHVCAEIRGDPHITPFTGGKFDCQGQGEFVAMKTLTGSANELFEVQARFNSGIKQFSGEGGITVMKGISIESGISGVPSFQAITADDGGDCTIDYYLDGAAADWASVDSTVIDLQIVGEGEKAVHYVYFPGTGLMYTVTVKNGSFGCRMNSKICVPPEFLAANKVVGLLGNMQGPWMDKTGKQISRGTSMKSAYEYCTKTWCVSAAESIFDYFNGETHATYDMCSKAYDNTVETMLQNPEPMCTSVCPDIVEEVSVADKDAALANCFLECAEDGLDGAIADMADANLLEDIQLKCPGPELEDVVTTPAPQTPAVPAPQTPAVPAPQTPAVPAPTVPAPAPPAPQIKLAPPAPVEEPTEAVRSVKGAFGDPHVRTWSGEHYEYHGACDLVLVHNPEFANGLGMDIHIRNKRVKYWSYIETAVLRIGGETLEVKGGENTNDFWVNGVQGNAASESGMLPETIAGYPIKFDWLSQGRRRFVVDLGNGEQVIFKTFKYFIRVNILAKNEDNFKSSVGLMGTYPEGKKVGRDLSTVLEDYNEFGQEWQVLPGEPMLFHNVEGAQAPSKCELPVLSTQRRLAESSISLEDAEIACSRVSEEDRDACIFDVLATEDKDMAGAY